MNHAMPRHCLTAVALVLILMATAGCKFMSLFNKPTDLASGKKITRMPSVTVTDVDAAGVSLTSAGLTVLVKREPMMVTPGKATGLPSFVFPETVRPFQPSQWNHMVAAQDPPPGTPVRPGSIVTLTAGIHHGAGRFRPWLDAHGASVQYLGEQRCQDCHTQAYCSDCHDKVKVRTHPR